MPSSIGIRKPSVRRLLVHFERTAWYVLLAWIPVVLFSLYFKYVLVEWDGFLILARQLGRIGIEDLSWWEKASFFRDDIFYGFLLFPLVFLIIGVNSSRTWRSILVFASSLACAAVIFVQLRSFYGVGTFSSFDMLLAAVTWVSAHPAEFSVYVPQSSLIKFSALLLVILFGFYATSHIERSGPFLRKWRKMRLATLSLLFVWSVLALYSIVPPQHVSASLQRSVILQSFAALFSNGDIDSSSYSDLSGKELVQAYRSLAQAPQAHRDERFWGKADGYDLLFFVLETAPARYFSLDEDLDQLPTLRELAKHSFIGLKHHSTFPYTNRAMLSLLTSLYPSTTRKSFLSQYKGLSVPSIARTLSSLGYEATVYSPNSLAFESDDLMYRTLGFKSIRYPDGRTQAEGKYGDKYWRENMGNDRLALRLLKADIKQAVSADKRYFALYLPQISHGPWPDVSKEQNAATLQSRARELFSLQDSWLNEIVQLLRSNGRLERTIIVLTADHGLRTRQEYPDFAGGMIDDISFHVPLLIFAPQILEKTRIVSELTSHIDVVPTLLDLYGIEQDRELEQGTALWDSKLEERITYLFANAYLGSDGFFHKNTFYTWNRVFDQVFLTDQLQFDQMSPVDHSSELYQQVTTGVRQMTALQYALGRVLAEPNPVSQKQ